MAVSSYEVGAAFIIDAEEANATLGTMAERFGALAEAAENLQQRLSTIGEGAFTALQTGLDRLTEAFTGLDTQIGHISELVDTGMSAAGQSVDRMVGQVNALNEAWQRANTTAGQYRGGGGGLENDIPPARRGRGGGDGLYGPPTLEDAVRPFGTGDDYANANAENRNRDAVSDTARRQAEYENRQRDAEMDQDRREADYENTRRDAEERQRTRESRPDEPYEREGGGGRSAESASAGFLGGRLGHGGILAGMAPVLEGLEVFKSEQAAMKEELAITQTLQGMNIQPDTPEWTEASTSLRELARSSTKGTKFSEGYAAGIMPEAAPVLAMEGLPGIQTLEKIFPIALRLGELTEMRGKGHAAQEAVAGEELAHLMQRYEPAALEKTLDIENAVAMRTDTSISQQQRIQRYVLPTAVGAGLDVDKTVQQVGALELSLGATSTVGTGLARYIQTLENLGHGTKPENAAAAQLGLTAGGQSQVMHDGHLDMDAAARILTQYRATHQDAPQEINRLFNIQGGRIANVMSEPGAQDRMRSQEASFLPTTMGGQAPTVDAEQRINSRTSMQQFEQFLANIQNIGNTLATATLPGVNSALVKFNSGLILINDFLQNHPTLTTGVGYAAEGGLAAGAIGLLGVAGRRVGAVGRSALGMVGLGGAGEAGAAAAAGGSLVGPALAVGGISGLVGSLLTRGGDALQDTIAGKGSSDRQRALLDQGAPAFLRGTMFDWSAPNTAALAPVAPSATSTPSAAAQPVTPPAPGQVHVNIGPVTMNGVSQDDHTFNNFLSRMGDAVKGALATSSGPGSGSDSSPYVVGGF